MTAKSRQSRVILPDFSTVTALRATDAPYNKSAMADVYRDAISLPAEDPLADELVPWVRKDSPRGGVGGWPGITAALSR